MYRFVNIITIITIITIDTIITIITIISIITIITTTITTPFMTTSMVRFDSCDSTTRGWSQTHMWWC